MNIERLDVLRRIFKILTFAIFILFLCFLGAGQLGLVDSNGLLLTPPGLFAIGVLWVFMILWGIFAFLQDAKEPGGIWPTVSFWFLLLWVRVRRRRISPKPYISIAQRDYSFVWSQVEQYSPPVPLPEENTSIDYIRATAALITWAQTNGIEIELPEYWLPPEDWQL